MTVRTLFYGSHPLTRLFLGVAILGFLLAGHMLMLLAVAVVLVVAIDGGWRSILRSLAVLRWLVVPILLLHLLLTGGERLWPQTGLPLSKDGLVTGAVLSLNLMTFYIAAVLVSRLWRQNELLTYAPKLPYFGRRLLPYLLALPAVRRTVQGTLWRFKQQFELRRAWRQSGVLLTAILRHMFEISVICSRCVWLRWHDATPTPRAPWVLRSDLPVGLLGILLLGGACLT